MPGNCGTRRAPPGFLERVDRPPFDSPSHRWSPELPGRPGAAARRRHARCATPRRRGPRWGRPPQRPRRIRTCAGEAEQIRGSAQEEQGSSWDRASTRCSVRVHTPGIMFSERASLLRRGTAAPVSIQTGSDATSSGLRSGGGAWPRAPAPSPQATTRRAPNVVDGFSVGRVVFRVRAGS